MARLIGTNPEMQIGPEGGQRFYDAERQRFEQMGLGASGRQAPMFDRGGFDIYGGMRNQSLAGLQAAAMGRGPSAAQLQQQQGLGQARAGMNSLAASMRGVSPGAAMRTAAMAGGDMQTRAMQQAAILRAQEQAAARQAFSQALMGYGGQELQIGGANQNAALQQTGLNDAQQRAMFGYGQQQNALAYQQQQLQLQQLQEQDRRAMQAWATGFDTAGQVGGMAVGSGGFLRDD